MGLLFVLLLGIFVLGVLSFVLGIPCLLFAVYLQKRKKIKVELLAWFLAPGILVGCFGLLFLTENVIFYIITDEDVGIGDYASVNINDKYHLYWSDTLDWQIGTRDPLDEKTFCHIQGILVHNDTIVFTSEVNGNSPDSTYYVLTQLIADNALKLDSAKSTPILWDKYAKTHIFDRNKFYTCCEYCEYYWNTGKQHVFLGTLILYIIVISFIIKKYWRKLLLKKSQE